MPASSAMDSSAPPKAAPCRRRLRPKVSRHRRCFFGAGGGGGSSAGSGGAALDHDDLRIGRAGFLHDHDGRGAVDRDRRAGWRAGGARACGRAVRRRLRASPARCRRTRWGRGLRSRRPPRAAGARGRPLRRTTSRVGSHPLAPAPWRARREETASREGATRDASSTPDREGPTHEPCNQGATLIGSGRAAKCARGKPARAHASTGHHAPL
jgi:hypothetical protein